MMESMALKQLHDELGDDLGGVTENSSQASTIAAINPSSTQVLKTLRAGSAGTLRMTRIYGKQLLYVRHRLDPSRRLRLTTIELVVATRRAMPYLQNKALYPLRVHWKDQTVRQRLIDAGAEWDHARKVWWLAGFKIRSLKLVDRVMVSLAKKRSR